MQVRLRNNTGGVSKIGQLVRVDPKNSAAFINVTDLTTLPVIGAVAQTSPPGNPTLINLIGNYDTSSTVIISPVPPTSPAIGTIWIQTTN
jgi:hypothetical protein